MNVAHLPGLPEPRDIGLERRITAEAASRLHADPEQVGEFIIFAETRATPAPVRDLHTRDFRQEALEEFGDARNYLVWRWLQAHHDRDHVAQAAAMRALTHAIAGGLETAGMTTVRSIHA